jgi:hypothetical protein
MSNNIFLRSNNRFNVLDDDLINTPNKQKNNYDSSNNLFKSQAKVDNIRNNHLSLKESISKDFYNIDSFPDLMNTTNTINTTNKKHTEKTTNFKDILVNVVEDINVVNGINGSKQIAPGLVQITKIKGTITYNFGILAQHTINHQEDDSCNYNMNKAISDINNNRKKYENEYDSINGENAFSERFTMKPIYGSSYDSDEDEVSTDDNNDNDDCDYDEI